ncbi:hypothetical protein Mapa_003018 [Marchantia paleacea]|nr:hypothetical protein Mapa_003018 [Marchantia paleacea]
MGAAADIEGLMVRSQFMREAMIKSQTISDNMITILSSFDHRLSTLEAAMRPTQAHTSLSLFASIFSWSKLV